MPSPFPAKPLPVYLQIAELLARQIKAGYWHSGERLPTEAELAQTLPVAVGTLRKSLGLLEEQGVLERIQGSGTYVRRTQNTQQIYELKVQNYQLAFNQFNASILPSDKLLIAFNDLLVSRLNYCNAVSNVLFTKSKIDINNKIK